MDWIISTTQLGQLESTMVSRAAALTGVTLSGAPWGHVDEYGEAHLVQGQIDSWDAFLAQHGSADTAADVALAATGLTLAQLQSVPASDHEVRLRDYLPASLAAEPFQDIDFRRQTTSRLYRQNTLGTTPADRGVLTSILWHGEATGDPPVLSVPLVREDFAYVRDLAGLSTRRTQTLTWIRRDGQDHPVTKQRTKFYDDEQRMREAHRRRSNMVSMAQGKLLEVLTLGLGSAATAKGEITSFVGRLHDAFRRFVDNEGSELVTAIPSDGAAWLDSSEYKPGMSLRDYLVAWFSGQVV